MPSSKYAALPLVGCAGAEDIVDYISHKLNIQVGETTPDGMFTLKTVECLGSCGTAPMIQVGKNFMKTSHWKKLIRYWINSEKKIK